MSQPSYSCPVASNVLTGSVTLLRTTPEDEDCLYLKVTAPLAYEKDQDLDTTLNTTISAKRLQKKKIDKFAYTVKKDDDTKSLIKARWFIKKDGKFTYPLAQVHPTVKLSYRTGLRECIKRADISYERRTKVMKMLDKNPDINPAQLSSEDMADVDLVWSLVAMPSETNMPEEYAVSKLDGRVWCMSFWRLFKMKRVL